MKLLPPLIAGAFSLLLGAPASASILLSAEQSGADVVFTLSGDLDLAGIPFLGDGGSTAPSQLNGTDGDKVFILNGGSGLAVYEFSAIEDPFSPTAPGTVLATSSSGDEFAFVLNSFFQLIYLPGGYQSNTALSGSSTYVNHTFASLGLLEGTFVQSFANGQTLTLEIGGMAPVPLPASLPLLLASFAGLGAMLRRKASGAA